MKSPSESKSEGLFDLFNLVLDIREPSCLLPVIFLP